MKEGILAIGLSFFINIMLLEVYMQYYFNVAYTSFLKLTLWHHLGGLVLMVVGLILLYKRKHDRK